MGSTPLSCTGVCKLCGYRVGSGTPRLPAQSLPAASVSGPQRHLRVRIAITGLMCSLPGPRMGMPNTAYGGLGTPGPTHSNKPAASTCLLPRLMVLQDMTPVGPSPWSTPP